MLLGERHGLAFARRLSVWPCVGGCHRPFSLLLTLTQQQGVRDIPAASRPSDSRWLMVLVRNAHLDVDFSSFSFPGCGKRAAFTPTNPDYLFLRANRLT